MQIDVASVCIPAKWWHGVCNQLWWETFHEFLNDQMNAFPIAEFDRFLAERAKEAENLPDAAPNSGNRRQMQKDEQDSALFAL
jgi:hypothetical protein